MGFTKNLGWVSQFITATREGKVGINKVNPNTDLDIDGDTTVTGSLVVTQGITGSLLGTATTASFTNVAGLGGFVQGGNSFGSQATIGTNDNQSLALETSGSTRMFISSSGYVGVGTTTPSEKLEVSGSIKANSLITGLTSYDTNGLTIRNAANSANAWSINKGAGDGSENWQFYNFGRNSIDFTLNNSTGYIGIGTTSPSRRLVVAASNGSDWISATFAGTGGTDKVVLGNLAGAAIGSHNSALNAWSDFTIAGTDLKFSPYGSEAMRVSAAGKVGIGTTNPQTPLDVIGNITCGSSTGNDRGLNIYSEASTSGYGRIRFYSTSTNNGTIHSFSNTWQNGDIHGTSTGAINVDGTNGVTLGSWDNPGLVLSNSTNKVYIRTHLGIGWTNPSANLQVLGNCTIGDNTNGTAYIAAFGGAAYFGNGDHQHALWIYNNGTYAFTGGPASDRRAKENINDLDFNATEKVMALQPKSYYMKSNSKQIRYGFIAQDVHELLPDLICGDLDGEDYVGLDYNGIISVLTKAIQEQNEMMLELKAEIEILKNK